MKRYIEKCFKNPASFPTNSKLQGVKYLNIPRALLLHKDIHSQSHQIIGNRLDKLYSKGILICFVFLVDLLYSPRTFCEL